MEIKLTERQIFCVAPRFAYNNPKNGLSYEFVTVFKCLQDIFSTCQFVDVYQPRGIDELLSTLSAYSHARPVVLYMPFTGAITQDIADEIRKKAELGIFHLDDTWRHETVDRYREHCDWFTTSDPNHHWRYQGSDADKVRYLPFGYDQIASAKCRKPFHERDIDISFVGAKNEYRSYVIEKLSRLGIRVECFGAGWPSGVVNQDDFFSIVGRSRLSLNLSNSSQWDVRFLARNPVAFLRNLKSNKTIEQMKARHLEVAALGSCQLSFYSSGLEQIFQIGKDILVYPNIEELAYILQRITGDEVEMIAKNGIRAVSQYSYQQAFQKLIN